MENKKTKRDRNETIKNIRIKKYLNIFLVGVASTIGIILVNKSCSDSKVIINEETTLDKESDNSDLDETNIRETDTFETETYESEDISYTNETDPYETDNATVTVPFETDYETNYETTSYYNGETSINISSTSNETTSYTTSEESETYTTQNVRPTSPNITKPNPTTSSHIKPNPTTSSHTRPNPTTSTHTKPNPSSETTSSHTRPNPTSETTSTHTKPNPTTSTHTKPNPSSETTSTHTKPNPSSEPTSTQTKPNPSSETTSTHTRPNPSSETTSALKPTSTSSPETDPFETETEHVHKWESASTTYVSGEDGTHIIFITETCSCGKTFTTQESKLCTFENDINKGYEYVGNGKHASLFEHNCKYCNYKETYYDNPINCNLTGPKETLSDGLTVIVSCPDCFHDEVVHKHNLGEPYYEPIDQDCCYENRECKEDGCDYVSKTKLEHTFIDTGSYNPLRGHQYACTHCATVIWSRVQLTSSYSLFGLSYDEDKEIKGFNLENDIIYEQPKSLIKKRIH